ncbi:MAG: GNAT family N-acetyltransferase, partial [Candidatus Thermoplasmatota archaeon]|nr:GNAT family N-acetyltransferase [Candidatus Thermoplasmatota archaeon]
MSAERDARWLLQRLREEEDLRPPYRLQREQRWVMEATVLRDERGDPMAYTELRKHLGAVELTTVVVDPHHRGKGLSHALVEAAV